MKLITHEIIENLNIEPIDCYNWVADLLANKSKILLPPKISMKQKDGVFCNVMPTILNDEYNSAGVKIVTRYPNRAPSLDSKIILFNSKTGEFLGMIDGNWVTTMRTGAVAAHSILNFAKKDFTTIALIGLGNTVRATIKILKEILNPNTIYKIKLYKYKNQADLFIEKFSSTKNFVFEVVETPQDLVSGSDVIISGATYMPNDFCEDKYFDEGVLVVPIHTLGFTNCDLFFDKIFADDEGHVCNFKYFDKFKSFSEVSDVINGNKKGRETDIERILVYNIGIAAHDIYFAMRIFQMAKKLNLQEIDLKEPKEKFWV